MHTKNTIVTGKSFKETKKAMILVHGRGGNAFDILSLSVQLNVDAFALLAPQAINNTWYPYSFMAPANDNEPWLSSAIQVIDNLVNEITDNGIPVENIFITGFSQGACITLEYAARNAKKYGGIIAFTGGLIGDTINRNNYKGNFQSTPIFIGTSDVDLHVPLERVYATANILKDMGANVLQKVYQGMGHTINQDEIATVNKQILSLEPQYK
jgi:phospholipase/carboxylesterase